MLVHFPHPMEVALGVRGKKMKNTKVLLLAVTLIVASACQNKKSLEQQARTNAPSSEADTGLVVENASRAELEAAVSAHPEARVRIVNEKHGLFEVFGLKEEELSKFVNARIQKNIFVRPSSTQFGGLEPKSSIFSVPGPDGVHLPGMNRCKRATALSPTAVMTVLEPTTPLNFATVDISQKIKVNGRNSLNTAGTSELKTAIVILPPAASAKREEAFQVSELEFTPDALGIYQIFLVVQDKDDTCAMDGVSFIVTANRPYQGTSVPDVAVNFADMSHLGLMQAEAAWALSEGEDQLIAVLDTGVNYNHPSLAPNIYLNSVDLEGNEDDEDQNGFKNDVLGWDFVNGDAFPYDDAGHGSHVSGLAAGAKFGMARKAKILAVKVMSEAGGDIASIAGGIRYAVDRGARILNLSFGAEAAEEHPLIVAAVKYAEDKGALLVIAAGNGDMRTGVGFSIDDRSVFPAGLPNSNILTVASYDKLNTLAPYSNFGPIGVDIAAPGGWIPFDPVVSATHENSVGALFVGMSGTSMAAPIAAGVAAQVLALRPSLTVAELRAILIGAGTEKPDLKNKTVSGRHLNALSALQGVSTPAVLF